MISLRCPHCQTHYDLADNFVQTKVVCSKCGADFTVVDVDGNTQMIGHSAGTGYKSGADGEWDWQKVKNGAEEKLRSAFEFDKIENFSFSEFMSQLFKHHSWSEIEEYLCNGVPSRVPNITTVAPIWPAPWLFFRMMLITVVGVIFFYWKGDFFGWHNVFMPLLMLGVIGIPLASLIFFWELNIPKNVSMLLLIRIMIISGFLSIAITFFMHSVLGIEEKISPIWAGPIEETAKALTMLFFLRNKKYCYKLNGLLIGAAVGAGFAFIESGGYTIASGENADVTMLIRALFSPFGHIPWSAMVGAGLWRVSQGGKWDIVNRKFISLFICAVVMHMIWNSSLLVGDIFLKAIILGVLEYTLIIYLIQEGINEIRDIRANGGEPVQYI